MGYSCGTFQRACRGHRLNPPADSWAKASGLSALTLTTFKDISWNRPLYEHLGFAVLAPDELTPGLAAIREAEAKRGLEPVTRVCMRRMISPAS
jgi:hypothetical protein